MGETTVEESEVEKRRNEEPAQNFACKASITFYSHAQCENTEEKEGGDRRGEGEGVRRTKEGVCIGGRPAGTERIPCCEAVIIGFVEDGGEAGGETNGHNSYRRSKRGDIAAIRR